jgi:hypothetical protein
VKKLTLLVFALMIVSAQAMAITIGTDLGYATVKSPLGPINGALGLGYTPAGSVISYCVKVEYPLTKLGEVAIDVGAFYADTSPATGAVTGLTCGALVNLASNFAIGADYVLVRNAGGASTYLVPGAAVAVKAAINI